MSFDPKKFQEMGIHAILASMRFVRPFILSIKDIGSIEVKKHDDTLVTAVDRGSEQIAIPILQTAFPGVPLVLEESGLLQENLDSSWEMWMDGIDGTNAFTLGSATPTIILCAYNRLKKQLVGAIVGEPSTGRIWSACSGLGCHLSIYEMVSGNDDIPKLLKTKVCQVWYSDFLGKTAYIDVPHGFTRGKEKRSILTEENMSKLLSNLRIEEVRDPTGKIIQKHKVKFLILGSNGLNHALVANGNPGLIGTITTAMGGPWDTPTLLGIEAGGFGRGFRVNPDRTLTEADILDPLSYDIAIVAGSQAGLDFLSKCVTSCF